MDDKFILDAACGGRRFWFDRQHPNALYVDNRPIDPMIVGKGKNARVHECQPDKVMDFRALDLPDESFSLVVFDPPHFVEAGERSFMAIKYGTLKRHEWREDLAKGFAECFRVLKPGGVLIFKWNEYHIPLKTIVALAPYTPLFGHPSGKQQNTHWVTFMKLEHNKKETSGADL